MHRVLLLRYPWSFNCPHRMIFLPHPCTVDLSLLKRRKTSNRDYLLIRFDRLMMLKMLRSLQVLSIHQFQKDSTSATLKLCLAFRTSSQTYKSVCDVQNHKFVSSIDNLKLSTTLVSTLLAISSRTLLKKQVS